MRSAPPLPAETVKALRGATRLAEHLDALLAAGETDPIRLFRLMRGMNSALSEAWTEMGMRASMQIADQMFGGRK